jgi:N-acetylneuraminic acid mutarotase
MKTKSKISGYVVRSAAYAVFLSVAFIAASSASNSPNTSHKSADTGGAYDTTGKTSSQPRTFSFAERVAFQRAIEDVYWRHRIWPKENPDPKPSLDAVMSQAQLENTVAGCLGDSIALEDYWQKPITAEQLQAEIDRMARDTKQPEVLRELFEALGNDPAVIAECLARPILAERLITDLSVRDQTRHVESPQTDAFRTMSVATTLGQVVYTLPEIPEITDACTDDTWAATTTANAPLARSEHTAVWTGTEMIVWGGGTATSDSSNTGGRYNPSTDSWTATSTTNAPEARRLHSAVWTGTEMIVWGGRQGTLVVNTGGRYNPSTDTWTATSTVNAPSARGEQTAIWTGSEMIVWGGYEGVSVASIIGGKYNPSADSWTATSATNAPHRRGVHTAVWTGSEMIVWGGDAAFSGRSFLNTGGRYNPSTDSWRATSLTNAPSARELHTAVWTGSEMIVWGGHVVNLHGRPQMTNTGGKYNPGTNSWIVTSRFNAPTPRTDHTAVWTGSEMIVWGGSVGGPPPFNTGGRYQPAADSWTATSTTNAPEARRLHTAVWTGSEMIVWGGSSGNTGGRYCAQPARPPITVIQPNGGEVWTAGRVHQIRWNANVRHTDHLIIQYSRDGGASWFRIAQDIPAFTVAYWWQVDNFPTAQGRIKILLQEDRSITDESDANFTVQRP